MSDSGIGNIMNRTLLEKLFRDTSHQEAVRFLTAHRLLELRLRYCLYSTGSGFKIRATRNLIVNEDCEVNNIDTMDLLIPQWKIKLIPPGILKRILGRFL
jgi:hypothetical protein